MLVTGVLLSDDQQQPEIVEEKPKRVDPTGNLDEVSDDTSEVDKLLAEDNPQFAQSLGDIGPELSNAGIVIESIDFDAEESTEVSSNVSPYEKLKVRFKRLKHKIGNSVSSIFISIKYLLVDLFTETPKKILKRLKAGIGRLVTAISNFRDWHWKKKLAFVLVFISLGGVTALYFMVVKGKLLDKPSYPYLGSFTEVANFEGSYDPNSKAEIEPFYNSARIRVYAFEMDPFFVNLKRLPTSGKNPMGMFNFVFEGNNREVLVEMKTSESLFKDEAQRYLETLSYDEIEDESGKRAMQSGLRELFNEKLSKGEIMRVQLKAIILNP